MIKHKINCKNPICYEEKVYISKNKLQRIKRCLEEESLEEMSDEELTAWSYKRDARELIFDVDFADGSSLVWYLCSGTHNYYDDVTFFYNDGSFVDLDCTYELEDIEVETDCAKYCVKLVIE